VVVPGGVQVIFPLMKQYGRIPYAEQAGKIIRLCPLYDNGFNQDRICIGLPTLCTTCGSKDHDAQQAQCTKAREKSRKVFFAHCLRIIKKPGEEHPYPENIRRNLFMLRGSTAMLDRDLEKLYGNTAAMSYR